LDLRSPNRNGNGSSQLLGVNRSDDGAIEVRVRIKLRNDDAFDHTGRMGLGHRNFSHPVNLLRGVEVAGLANQVNFGLRVQQIMEGFYRIHGLLPIEVLGPQHGRNTLVKYLGEVNRSLEQ
jgi:hypothetical protein